MNPRFLTAYSAEDFMGQLLSSAKASVPGSKVHLVGNNVLANFTLALDVLLSQWARDV